MSILIIGGLFVIGLAALVGLFFVIRTDAPTNNVATPKVSPTPVENREVVPQPQVTKSVPDVDATERLPYVPQVRTQSARETEEQPLKVRLNGQFHELADGLRSLQQQTVEMEQRLGSLNQIIHSIEHDGER